MDVEYWFKMMILGTMGLAIGIALAPEGLWVLIIFLGLVVGIIYTVYEKRDMFRSEPDIEDV